HAAARCGRERGGEPSESGRGFSETEGARPRQPVGTALPSLLVESRICHSQDEAAGITSETGMISPLGTCGPQPSASGGCSARQSITCPSFRPNHATSAEASSSRSLADQACPPFSPWRIWVKLKRSAE